MSRPSNSFTTLAGVPVHYDRLRGQDYGTRGIPHRFYVTDEFERKLDECFSHLWRVCPYDQAEVITSAGAYVAKPGFHGLGRALDLDGLFWPSNTFVTLYDGFQGRNLNLYIGIEAEGSGPQSLEVARPGELLQNLYQVIQDELGDTALRMPVEGALTAFVSHPEVQASLDTYEDEK